MQLSTANKRAMSLAAGAVAFVAAEGLWLPPLVSLDLRQATVRTLIFASNLFYLYNLIYHISLRPRWTRVAYLGWYVALVALFVGVAHTGHQSAAGPEHREQIRALHIPARVVTSHLDVADPKGHRLALYRDGLDPRERFHGVTFAPCAVRRRPPPPPHVARGASP